MMTEFYTTTLSQGIKTLLLVILCLNTTLMKAQQDNNSDNQEQILKQFEEALKQSQEAHRDTLLAFLDRHSRFLLDCKNKYMFYKQYANHHYYNDNDSLFLQLQLDSILPMQLACLPEDHDDITTTYTNIGTVYKVFSDFYGKDCRSDTEKYYKLAVNRQLQSDTILPSYAKRYSMIALYYSVNHDFKKAENYIDRAISVYQGDKSDYDYLEMFLTKADCFIEFGKYSEAIKILDKGLKLAESNPDD